MFKHILVPTDGSALSMDAVTRAVSFAKEAGAHLTFFYVEPELPAVYGGVGAISDPHATQTVHERLESAARQILGEAQRQALDAGVSCQRVVKIGGKPYQAIVDAARDNACDLIFMASHGRHGIGALLLGSQTHKVLTHSTVPVLVYR